MLQEGWRPVFLSRKLGTTTSQFHTHQSHRPSSLRENYIGPALSNDLWFEGKITSWPSRETWPLDTQWSRWICIHKLTNFKRVIWKESQFQIFNTITEFFQLNIKDLFFARDVNVFLLTVLTCMSLSIIWSSWSH